MTKIVTGSIKNQVLWLAHEQIKQLGCLQLA